nr:uncharacterized protein K02A2.6-like [Helicoverpa armigera]
MTPQKMSSLPPVEPLQCDGDPMSLGLRWEKWRRALEIYLLASEIKNPVIKRATLLHMGGTALQEVYYNIPGAHIEGADVTDSTDVYKVAIDKLNEYFLPKQSKVYERHIFRLLKQETDERFEKFLVRLRQQSKKCKFANGEDDNIIDQVVEKCNSMELKKKILTLGDDVTLDKVIAEANAIESVQRQLSDYGNGSAPRPIANINKIDTKREFDQNKGCSRCGSEKHNGDSPTCPAKDKKCSKCGYIGHFMAKCRTRASKRRSTHANGGKMPIKKIKHDNSAKKSENSNDDQKKASSNVNYIFYFDGDGKIRCGIGGVDNVELLIDSGSNHNILTDKTWAYLKSCNVQATKQNAKPDKTFMAYGSSVPLTVLGSFQAVIKIGAEQKNSTFYVIQGGTRDLLGKETATDLKVLKLGLDINAVSESQNQGPFPKFKNITLDIAIDNTITPVSQPCRRIPVPLEEKVNKRINELIELDIIEAVNKPSRWVSPVVVPVLKSDGSVRLCVDMRVANKAILREHYPLPTMDKLLPKFRKARIFSKLDIRDAFHQIEISEESRHITTFITTRGLFRYKRLMFGISCAPELFQKTLERILLPCEGTLNFIDDIIVYGSDEVEHKARLDRVLEVLKEYNVTLNQKKCVFNAKVVEFLGHQLSSEGVKPLDTYIKSVETFREPKTIDEIQSFLGLLNYVNKWIPNFSTTTEPIRKLLKLKVGQKSDLSKYWEQEQKTAFDQLKVQLQNIKSLGYYDPEDHTQVLADASPVGLGAVLVQIDEKGPRVIAFGNRSLSEIEKRYCQTEKEALALVWAVEHFHVYLYGRKTFDLITDHKPLEVIFGLRSRPCARIERWVLRLQSYNFRVIYRPGKSNIADPFSRLCQSTHNTLDCEDESHINQLVQYARPCAIPMQTLIESSETDEEIQLVKEALNTNTWEPRIMQYRIFQTELWTHDGILLRNDKIVIPISLRKQVLDAAHEGHPGIVAMKGRLRTKVWWPKIDRDAEAKVKSCRGCTLVSAGNPPLPLKRRQLPDQAWQDVAIDFLGPLPSGHYLLVIVDYYSRYKEIKVMKSITTADTTTMLKEIFSRLGIPMTLTADNGRQFTSQEFRDFCQEMGIKLLSTTPYTPQENGEVERQNRDILKRLQISQTLKSDWQSDLLDYLMMCNSTPHSTTGKTPGELFFSRKFRDKLPSIVRERSGVDEEVRDKDIIMKEKGKSYEDRRRKATEYGIEVGEKVYVKNMTKGNKLTAPFNSTPHTVLSSSGNEYKVRNDDSGQEYRRNIVHLKKVQGEWQIYDPEKHTQDVALDSNEALEDTDNIE